MVRRILQCLALLALLLGSPAMGLAGPEPARACCCGGEEDSEPCGMPTCPPRCPTPGSSLVVAAPAPVQAQVRLAAQRRGEPRREPQPWAAPRYSVRTASQVRPASPAHGPPPGPSLDRQAQL